ncbi:MAG: TetR/AcrR family transcriptional regulator [Pseudomonadota bacterium]
MPALSTDAMEDRREALLLAAFRVFGRKGYHSASIRDICKEAGTSVGGLYVHFNGKEDIIAAVAEMFRSRREKAVEAQTSDTKSTRTSARLSAALRAAAIAPYRDDRATLLADVALMGQAVHIPALKSVLQETDKEHIARHASFIADAENLTSQQKSDLAHLVTAVGYGLVTLSAYDDEFRPDGCIRLLESLLANVLDAGQLSAAGEAPE